MKKIQIYIFLSVLFIQFGFSQTKSDTLKVLNLKELVVNGKTGLDSINETKPTSTIDEHLEKLNKINLIKRGGYAWEPTINNMATERISVTIDGMKIFCACTDRMDPVTSYVEILNLNNIHVGSGFGANQNATNSIGGSIDLKLQKAGFHERKFNLTLNSAYETNGNYKTLGAGVSYSSPKVYVNSGVFYRNSDNYIAGSNEIVNFSQFEKLNLFTNAGYLLENHSIVEGTVIYDVATNVGYPALTMDVKSAKGLITSLSYRDEEVSDVFSTWETKVYYNTITHIMDDTKRPNVVMHMDMPGKSNTGGYYSTLKGRLGKHNFMLNHDAYYNQSLAEMTMYPVDNANPPMFMYTWPDVRTINTGFFAEDKYMIDIKNVINISAKVSVQRDGVQSDFGYNTLKIYYPEMAQYQNRFVGSVSAKYIHYLKDIQLKFGGGFGSRAPSATEAYGFYLFNSFDNYDYIGNPDLKNESSVEGNVVFALKKKYFSLDVDASYFYFNNYIIGKPNVSLYYMTLGASGVKVYQNLNHASIFNSNIGAKLQFLHNFYWINKLSYSLGQDGEQKALPLIAPFSYATSLEFRRKTTSAAIEWKGAAQQKNFSAEYGEDETPAYSILNVSAGYEVSIQRKYLAIIKGGVENIFDKKYSTYSDWNNIPRKGRNVFMSLTLHLL